MRWMLIVAVLVAGCDAAAKDGWPVVDELVVDCSTVEGIDPGVRSVAMDVSLPVGALTQVMRCVEDLTTCHPDDNLSIDLTTGDAVVYCKASRDVYVLRYVTP